MVQAVTGSGKTLLALTAASRLESELNQELRVKIVVPTSALMRQWNCALKEFLGGSGKELQKEIGLRGAGSKFSGSRHYMIYVINTARYELARQILTELQEGKSVLLIADECHRYESGQNRLIFEFLPHMKPYENRFFSLGLSATLPSGRAQSYLASVLGRRSYHYGMLEAASMNTVCPYDIYHVELSFLDGESEEYEELSERMNYLYRGLIRTQPGLKDMGAKELFDTLRLLAGSREPKTAKTASLYLRLSYKRRSLVCLASSRVSCACALLKRLPEKEKVLIFGERISQAEELYRLLQEQFPGRVGRFHSKMGQTANQNVLNRFRDGEIRILIACKAIDEGLDIPDASVGIILSGTSVQRQRIQRLGRIIRKAEGKERSSLYYLHLSGTSEERFLLPETGKGHVFELKYLSDTQEFSHPLYDRAAEKLLSDLQLAGAGSEALSEARRCLCLGQIRSDYLTETCDFDTKIRESVSVRDRNYWICMKKLCKIMFS